MNKNLLSGMLFLLAVLSVQGQIVNIPDPVFKDFLIGQHYNTNPNVGGMDVYLDSNFDGEIQYTEAATYTSNIFNHGFFLNGGLNITDLTGIEAFQSIEYLNIEGNLLTSLNITGCLSLKELRCSNNPFTTLTLTNTSLRSIDCNNSPALTQLDLSGCTGLKFITCQNNPLLTNLSVDGCGALEELRVNSNQTLSSLQMGNHSQLKLFQCYSNQLTSLDLSSCEAIEYFYCTGNPLTSLNLANGNPQSYVQINASGFPDMTCIQVDNVAVSEYLWSIGFYMFDEWASFSTDCTPPGPCIVAIPDPNFKTALLGNAAINTNGNAEIECSEAEAYTGIITANNLNISDMTGIKAFVNANALSCNDNFLTALDVSGMTSLTTVSCTGSYEFGSFKATDCTALTGFDVSTVIAPLVADASGCTSLTGFSATSYADVSLDLSGCTALTSLNMPYNRLVVLDVSDCTGLTNLICNNNNLTVLNISSCSALTTVNCSNNDITSLILGNVPALTNLDCSFNELSSLNVLDSSNLALLNCSNNNLPYLLVSNNTHLTSLDCSTNHIGYLDVNNNPDLLNLNCSFNDLNAINVNSNTALTYFNCSSNNLNSQNVDLNTALLSYNCSNNSLTSQNVTLNTALTSFYCDHNNLESIDVSHNPNLKFLVCSNNEVEQLDLSANPALLQLDCSYNYLTGLEFPVQPNLHQLACNNNQLTSLDVSQTFCIMLACDNNMLSGLNLANGHNNIMLTTMAANNPNLECVQVDDATFSTQNWVGTDFSFDAGVSFSENCTLGFDDLSGNPAFYLYPNPTKGIVHFTRKVNVQLYNLTGQKIFEKENATSIDLSSQATGIYALIYTEESGGITGHFKIVKE